jgi:hypothetical protein
MTTEMSHAPGINPTMSPPPGITSSVRQRLRALNDVAQTPHTQLNKARHLHEESIYIYIPQVLQAPPKTVKELLWKIHGRQNNTRLKGIKEYSKIEDCFVWCLYRAITIQKCDISNNISITKQKFRLASRIFPTSFSPTICFSFY